MSQQQIRLNQVLSEDHLSALVASSLMSLVAVTRETKRVWGQCPQELFWFSALYLGLNIPISCMLLAVKT